MGEHGDLITIPWSHSLLDVILIQELEDRGEDLSILDEFYKGVQQAAYEIINRKKATYYGVGLL